MNLSKLIKSIFLWALFVCEMGGHSSVYYLKGLSNYVMDVISYPQTSKMS